MITCAKRILYVYSKFLKNPACMSKGVRLKCFLLKHSSNGSGIYSHTFYHSNGLKQVEKKTSSSYHKPDSNNLMQSDVVKRTPLLSSYLPLIQNSRYKSKYSKKEKRDLIDLFFEWVLYAATFYSLYWLVDQYLVSFSVVVGKSMQPLFNTEGCRFNDIVLISRPVLFNSYKSIQRGDIVIFMSTRDPTQLNIKRVVGLEGDIIQSVRRSMMEVVVPPGHVWVEGDNIQRSYDSNRVGPVPLGLVTGIATKIIWPPTKWQKLERKIPHSRIILNVNQHPLDIYLPSLEHDIEPNHLIF